MLIISQNIVLKREQKKNNKKKVLKIQSKILKGNENEKSTTKNYLYELFIFSAGRRILQYF
jgi:hypothetical protein